MNIIIVQTAFNDVFKIIYKDVFCISMMFQEEYFI